MQVYVQICATGLLTGLCVDLAKAVVTHLVHKTVEEDRWAFTVDSELPGGSVVVVLFDVSARVGTSSNANHPQKLIDICNSEWSSSNKCNKHSQSGQKRKQK